MKPECRQHARDRSEQPDPARCESRERHQELGPIGRVHRPRPEDQQLARAQQRGEQHGAQPAPHFTGGERRGRPPDRSPHPAGHSPKQDRGAGDPDDQRQVPQPRRHRRQQVAVHTRIGREHAGGADRLRITGRQHPAHVQRPGAPALPMVDLEPMRTGLQCDGASPGAHLGRNHHPAVHPHEHAVVGARPQVDPFRTRGEPHAAPANDVVPVGQVLLAQEVQIQARGPLFDARDARGVECGRVGIAVEGIVVLAREPGGGRQGRRQLPERRQRDRHVQEPPIRPRHELEAFRPGEPSAHCGLSHASRHLPPTSSCRGW